VRHRPRKLILIKFGMYRGGLRKEGESAMLHM
jgi:hypothetical protein